MKKNLMVVLMLLSMLPFALSGQTADPAQQTKKDSMTISVPSSNFTLKPISMSKSGSNYSMTFLLTNHGDEIKQYGLWRNQYAKVFDELGNEYGVSFKFGQNEDGGGSSVHNTLMTDIPVKLVVTISNVNPQAKMFTIVKFLGETKGQSPFPATGEFIFKKVPLDPAKFMGL